MDIAYATAGALTGFLVGMTGVGGGALMTPVLLLFFEVNPITAIATDLWFAALTKLVGAAVHYKAGQVDKIIVKRLWLGSLPVALLTTFIISRGDKIQKIEWLTQAIGVVIFVTAIGLLLMPKLLAWVRAPRLKDSAHFTSYTSQWTSVAGAVLGLLVALTSVGAGTLGSVVLLFLYPLRMTPHKLVATDLVHAIPLAMAAGTGYWFLGLVDVKMLLSLLSGSVPAVILGSWVAGKAPGRLLQILLACVLMGTSLKMLT